MVWPPPAGFQFFMCFRLACAVRGQASLRAGPVSTTHVSVGSLFGIGLVTRQANPRVVSGILMSWFLTLPIAALLGGITYKILAS